MGLNLSCSLTKHETHTPITWDQNRERGPWNKIGSKQISIRHVNKEINASVFQISLLLSFTWSWDQWPSGASWAQGEQQLQCSSTMLDWGTSKLEQIIIIIITMLNIYIINLRIGSTFYTQSFTKLASSWGWLNYLLGKRHQAADECKR